VSLKIAPGRDIDRVRQVREAFPALMLAVDANESYRFDDAESRRTLASLDTLELAWIEQPFARTDLLGTAELQRSLDTPVALDEAIDSADALASAAALGAVQTLNVKPARFGAIAEVLRVHDLAVAHGIPLYCGGMMECGVGRAFGLAVAGLPGFVHPTHLGPSSRYFDEDITASLERDERGQMPVPQGWGLGVEPRRDRLRAVAVDRVLLRAP
jgi:O-succinylbenzoate synthase